MRGGKTVIPKTRESLIPMVSATQRIRFCTTRDGVRLAFATTGAGPSIVSAGHWLTHLELDWESPVWRPWYREFSSTHTFIRYDSRGCGLSDWKYPELSLDSLVSDLESVVDAAGASRFPLLSLADSAPVAIAYAARHPDRVSHLILLGGFTRGRLRRAPTPQVREEDEALAKLIGIGWDKENPAFRQVYTTLYIPDATPEQQQWFNKTLQASMSLENATRRLLLGYQMDVTETAKHVTVPTLIFHSAQDARVPMDEARLLASLIPGSKFMLLESKNRILVEQEPAWPRFISECRAFIGGPHAHHPAISQLTEREKALLHLIARGMDNLQIASTLGLSEKTVRNSNSRIFAKLSVENRSMAIVLARESGFGRDDR
jgi:pimeloyl-ACP methyl ester carboxylesterase/DNA-binding CsgD family transcriptional regulator